MTVIPSSVGELSLAGTVIVGSGEGAGESVGVLSFAGSVTSGVEIAETSVGAGLSFAASGAAVEVAFSSSAGGLSLAAAGSVGVVVEFAVSGCSEFVRSVEVVDAAGSRISGDGEITDSGRVAVAGWLNRALSWASVKQIAPRQSWSVAESVPEIVELAVSCWKLPRLAVMFSA